MLFDLTTLPAQDRYKLLASTIVPRPIAWVVSLNPAGRLNAAPYSFFNVFSDDPPLVCIGIGGAAPGQPKDTAANIRAIGEFVVNLVPAALMQAMHVTAIEFEPSVDELAEAGLTTLASAKVAPPRIAESPVALECVTEQVVALPNARSLVMGRVVAMHVRDDAVLDAARCRIDTPKLDLVGRVHGGGGYVRASGPGVFEQARIKLHDWARRT